MSQNLIVGQYVPGDSVIHRLDPRAKIIIAIAFLVVIFFANNWATYLVLSTFVVLALILSKVPFSYFYRGLKPLLILILFTVALQILFTPGQTLLFSLGPINVYLEGIINGIFIFLRFVLIIFISTLLTLTTMPLEITDAIEFMLAPLAAIKVPVHAIALMLSIALRFVPTLMEEVDKIMNAQRARGMDFGEGNLIQRMKNVVPLLIPLFISSFNRAIDLATAMEARGYHGGEGRTKFRKLTWETADTLALVFFSGVAALLFVVRT